MHQQDPRRWTTLAASLHLNQWFLTVGARRHRGAQVSQKCAINKFTNKHICFHNLFNVKRGLN